MRNAPLFAAALVVLLVPLAAAAQGDITRDINNNFPALATKHTVPNDRTTTIYGIISNPNGVLSGSLLVTVKPACGASTSTLLSMVWAPSEDNQLSVPLMPNDCWWINSTGAAALSWSGNAVWVNVTQEVYEKEARAVASRSEMNTTSANTYETKARAVASRAEMNATSDALFEGQQHANETWCPLSCAGAVGEDFQAWFNNTFLYEATFENVTAGNVSLMSAMQIETVADAYWPLLVWGGIAVACMIFNAWLPAIVAMMNWANLSLGIYGMSAATMFILIALALHTLVVQGIIPIPWRRDAAATSSIRK